MKIKPEDILFWILIALIVGLAIWKLVGSPTDTASLISLALFVAGSEILIWKTIFKIDKKTSVGFIKLRNDIDKRFTQMDNSFEKNNQMILNKLENIEDKLRRRQK
ncbi:hypothetical protein A3K73_05910 [Candidatus Pacearchaeota archaeon RBG_13_36_9]|nr:MAG: hypothetical protein A3K73_05910 [Candidatus Pacearchaeota archaeon RBG_13_36_9]